MKVLIFTLILLITCACILGTSYVFYNYIYLRYKKRSQNVGIEDLYQTLAVIISNEIDIYERTIFKNGGKVVTNATFDNFYKDICERVHQSLSEELMYQFSFYLTRDAVYKIITRTVQNYLTEKIM